MAELDLGTRCALSSCRQLDFLPFVCPGCCQTFCLEHRSVSAHHCPSEKGENIDNTALKCTSHSSPCSLAGCHKAGTEHIICQFCNDSFCLQHRHQEDHNCSALNPASDDAQHKPLKAADVLKRAHESVAARGNTASKLEHRVGAPSSSRSVKSSPLAAKVALMKLKSRATGDERVPQEERIFFEVILSDQGNIKAYPLFFSKEWSIGKAVDCCGVMLGLKNRNNIPSAPRLQLFDRGTGEAVGMSYKLQWCIDQGMLKNGHSLILDYSSTDKLTNLDQFNI